MTAAPLYESAPVGYKRRWLSRLRWLKQSHPYQQPPAGEWAGWLVMGGRGSGKTLGGAWDCAEHLVDNPGWRYGIVAATFGDARDVAIEGETGVLSVLDQMGVRVAQREAAHAEARWNRSLGELVMRNGARADIYGAREADRLRGPQHHRMWLEELAAWRDAPRGDTLNTAFNNMTLGLRLGHNPQWIATTTPRRVLLIRQLVERPNVAVTRGTTFHNIANLPPAYRDIVNQYEGTLLFRQEVLGELIDEVEGALWRWGWIDPTRLFEEPEWGRAVVAVDPTGSESNECGIVCAAELSGSVCPCGNRTDRQHYVILSDRSMLGSPEQWAEAVRGLADQYQAQVLVETNYGGAMAQAVLRHVGVNALPHPARGSKVERATPVVLLYQQGVVHHVGSLPGLEDEMTTWTEDSPQSPNRIDALAHAVNFLATKVSRRVAVVPSPTTRLRIG